MCQRQQYANQKRSSAGRCLYCGTRRYYYQPYEQEDDDQLCKCQSRKKEREREEIVKRELYWEKRHQKGDYGIDPPKGYFV